MLRQLVINDLAIIESINLEFQSGMTVLTGETGAGKSILLDALGLILGDRADTNLIRGGSDKTDITAIFSIDNNAEIETSLNELEIAADKELYIRRTIGQDGRSRAYLNNTPVPIQTLRDIGVYLIDIHGQHAHQSLSRAEVQRDLLDQFGQYNELLQQTTDTFHAWKQVSQALDSNYVDANNSESSLSLLKYQIQELNELNVSEGEYEKVKQDHKRLSNSQNILETAQKTLSGLSGSDDSIYDLISSYQSELVNFSELDERLGNITALLDSALIQIDEAVSELKDYIENVDTDNENLLQLEDRLDKLNELSRKHKVRPEALSVHLQALLTQIEQLERGEEQRAALEEKKIKLNRQYFKLAQALSEKRIQLAGEISVSVTEKMHELGIGGKFLIDVEAIATETPRQLGIDKITFMVSTNPGQPLRPLTKVASGGELSRLSLAIQVIALGDAGAPTLIFDEVDAGISGGVAEIVGQMLKSLSADRQVFCVTHLAQVAACGNHHLRVVKTTEKDKTYTQVLELDQGDRVNEVARLLAGMKVTEASRANAAQMLGTNP